MANVQEVLDTQIRIEESLAARMSDFEKTFKSAVSSDSGLSLDKLAQDYKHFKDTVWGILQLLRSQVQAVMLQTDDLESYNRRNALLFSGIEEKEGEDCKVSIIDIIHSTMNITGIQASAISFCHRLGSKNPTRARPILVRFADMTTRNLIWMEKKRLKSTSTVLSEFLTKYRQAVFSSARKHFGIHQVWTRQGAVFIKLPNNDRKRVTSTDELDQLISRYPSAVKSSNQSSDQRAQRAPEASSRSAAVPEAPTTRRNATNKAKFAKSS